MPPYAGSMIWEELVSLVVAGLAGMAGVTLCVAGLWISAATDTPAHV